MQHADIITTLVRRVRGRWRMLAICQAAVRAALASAGVVVLAVIAAGLIGRAPLALAVTGVLAVALGLAAAAWGVLPLARVPSDARVARFIEERVPSFDDRLVTAVDVLGAEKTSAPAPLVEPMLADAAARARAVDLDDVIPSQGLRRAGARAAGSVLILAAALFVARAPARQALDALAFALFPSRATLLVTPGHARIVAGSPLTIEAGLAANRAPIVPQVQIALGDSWRALDMEPSAAGRHRLALASVTSPFAYRVVAGAISSGTFNVVVAHPPRVTRIDLEYTFPKALGLSPRKDEDSGDIYAPAGTDVRVRVHTDRPTATARLALADGTSVTLDRDTANVVSGRVKVVEDGSYRVALSDAEGLANPGDIEYFIRTLEDRPPEVHITKPASDRSVTRLDEVDVEAQADDDYGIARMDFVYSVRGGPEQAVQLRVPPKATSVTVSHTLPLEDLDVKPGDFVSYYVRARDLTRGKRSSEARSDIFFLEIKPFEQEFSLAQSQSMAGGGYNQSIDDLVAAQKAIVVATWKLDRRSQSAKGAQSEQDIRSVARAEADLKSRVEQTSTSFRESTMRDPRRRQPPVGRGGEPQLRAGETMAEEDAMAAAAAAMARAVASLEALKTGPALPPEMEALNHLLKAQADVKERQITRQQAGAGGPGNNNRNYDVSTLFDKELQRTQQTNYETPTSAESRQDERSSALDELRDLARRQDELLKRQQELAKSTSAEDERRRELEKLAREQAELRQRAEDLARKMSGQGPQSGQRSSQSQPASGQQAQSGRGGGGDVAGRMREASDEMRTAAGDLRRQDPAKAGVSAARALDKLRELERQMSRPDDRRRALGDIQLETRQLAEGQRQVASQVAKAGDGAADKDALRRLAGEQERLADRARRLQDRLKQSGRGAAAGTQDKSAQAAASDAARDLEKQRLADRMQQAADDLRAAAGQPGADPKKSDARSGKDTRGQAGAQEEIARSLDKLADRLGGASGGNDDARKLSEQLARAQQLRDRLSAASRELEKLGPQTSGGRPNAADASRQKAPGETGRSGQGQAGGGTPGGVDLARLREEYARQLKETQDLLEQMQRDDPNFARGGAGFTYQGQGMTLSAPGTEAFKQDFARWEELRRQATSALDRAESSLSRKLQAQASKDRLAVGVDDRAPTEYQKQVDRYFKALAAQKKQ